MFALLTSSRLLAVVAEIVGQDVHANQVQHIPMKLPGGAPEPHNATSWAASWRKARARLAPPSDCATRMRKLRAHGVKAGNAEDAIRALGEAGI